MADRIPMSELESYLWGSAVLLRTNIDAGSYKQYIFPLLFFKRLCDVYDEETADFVAQYGDDADLFADDHTFIIPEGHHRLLPDLLPFIVNDDRFFDFAMEKSAGSLSPRVKWAQLAEYAFDLPDDIEEQRSHAKLLWAIERSRSAYQNLLSQMDELVKSQFVEMFEQHHLGEKYRQLRECCSNISGGKTPSMSQKEFYGGSIPFIKSGDVKGDSVSSGALWLTDAALEQGGAVLLPKETVIVVIRSAALRHEFHVAITNNPVVINQDLKAFQPKPEFLPIYLQWAIRSHEKALLSKVQSVLTSHIEMSDLLSIPVMEANIADQERFCDFIRQTDKSKLAIRQALESLEKSRSAIITKVFG